MLENRWVINILGLINFWCYDDEQFQLSDGKLLLRGTNGCGKSVTMQSFIPLLLDGNKSPERLDPFGTRSRKLENYLLDEDTDERTAYLYMEFKKISSENYITIGMGMKAQKGKSMDSWYFIINDGRRVNKDIFLYKKLESKVALTKKQLENELGTGNFFTEYQQKYMAKVNEVLFGYDDLESYEELLNLLIQLRSPKLSKDFQPTKIYEVLTNSLKLLSEEDLRPMSESMENMDQLQNSLEEKERSLKAVNNIKYYYDKYNRFCVLEKANEYDKANKNVINEKKEIEKLLSNKAILQTEQNNLENTVINTREELRYAEEKYESLRDNDGFKIKKRLEEIDKNIKYLNDEIKEKEVRLDNKKKDRIDKDWKLKEANDKRESLALKIKENLTMLSDIAEEFSFNEGQYIEKEVLENIEEYDFSYLDVCFQKYTSRIKEIKKLLKEYEQKSENLDRIQKLSDDFNIKKESKEGDLEKSNMILTEVKEELKEKYNNWEEKNKFMKLEKSSFNQVFKLISDIYGDSNIRAVGELDNPVTEVFNSLKGQKEAEIQFKKKNIEEVNKDIASLENEIKELQQEKDIEPDREIGVIKNRDRLKENNISYVPLYKAIDFNKNSPENIKKSVESALNDMGILDALIINNKDKEKALDYGENQWDKYIFTKGNMLSHNLSEYCNVSSDDLQGVSTDEVYNILQSIYLDQDKLFSIDENGNYNFGTLKGKASQIYEPKYIGILARKKHRQQLIEHRQMEIQSLKEKAEEIEETIENINNEVKTLDLEYRQRPSFKDIKEGISIIESIIKDIERLENEIIKNDNKLFTEKKVVGELKGKIYEEAQGIALDKTLNAFEDAEELAADFRENLSKVKIIQANIINFSEKILVFTEDIENIEFEIDDLYKEISVKKDKYSKEFTEEKALKDTLSTFNIGAMEEEMDRCLDVKKTHPSELERLQKRSGEVKNSLGNLEENLSILGQELLKLQKNLNITKDIFLEELSLKYVIEDNVGEPIALLKKALKNIEIEENKGKNDYYEQLVEAHHKNAGELREFNSKIVHIFQDDTDAANNEDRKQFADKRKRIDISCRAQGREMYFNGLMEVIKKDIDELKLLISTEERRIFEEVLLNTISTKISAKIWLSRKWVDRINSLMESMDTSSSLKLSLKWIPKKAEREDQLDVVELLEVLERGGRASEEDMKKLAVHFGDKVREAIRSYSDTGEARNYQSIIKDVLDYRKWYEFKLFFTKKNDRKKELTNNAFFQFSGGEKAMSMYIPLFSAVYARYQNARNDCPRVISMDEAFAGVDENNIRDMFRLLKELKLDYLLNSQVLWGDYDTVDNLAICELIREENEDVVSIIRYHWNGIEKRCLV